ncbi:EamA family transporter [Candidatus Micrarchaeota archaeon]|nr:EamA family transporter [Candidatus Micrarchaeota archaeon]
MQAIRPLLFVLASAVLFGLSVPLAKVLVADVPPVSLAGLLYFGAFLGLSVLGFAGVRSTGKKIVLDKKEMPWLALVVLFGGVLGPVFLMVGLSQVSGFAASLFLNLEGMATALVASAIFREFTGRRFWVALCCMTVAGLLLSWSSGGSGFSPVGPIFIVLAMVFWGLDNNFTRKITSMEPVTIARVKCFFAGVINLGIGFLLGAKLALGSSLLFAVVVGTFSYGISLVVCVRALRAGGAGRTGAFFSVAPFVGAVSSVLILKESVGWNLLPAFVLMAAGAWLIINEKHAHWHHHGGMYHAHEHLHDDKHQHGHPTG